MEQRSIGRHAGGVLIADERELEQTMPLISVRGDLQTPWTEGMNFRNLEDNGFIKFDFLGLTLMKDVENCIRRILIKNGNPSPTFLQIRDFFDEHLNCRYIGQDDQKVWENTYHNASFAPGIFQFTAQGARNFCHQAKPRNIEELAAITAIYRPGPLKANVHVKYVEAGKDIENIQYAHPIIEEVLGPTRGFITFQEQFMTLAVKLAGFSPGESDKMRKTLVKKSLDTIGKKGSERDQLRKQFVEGAERLHGLDPKDMNDLFDKIEFFSLYGFNKSHAVAYAIDSYYAAWLYTYHPREWIATVLESENNSPQGLAKAIRESKALGYKFAPADVNYSGDEWTYNKELQALMPPLSSIKGLGDKAMDEILSARPFKNLNDLFYDSEGEWRHSKVNKTCFEALCQIEAFSSLEEFKEGKLDNHRQLLHIISENYEKIRKGRTGEDKLRERLVRIGEQIKDEFDKILRVYEKTKMSDLQEQACQHIFNCSIVDWCYSEHAADLVKDIGHPNHKRQAQLDKCFERLTNYYARRDKLADRIETLFNIDTSILGVSHIKDWSRDEKIVLYQQITSAINNALVFPVEVMRRIEKADVKSICEMVGGDKGVAWGCATEIIKKKTKNGKEFYRIRMMDDQNRTAWLRVWGKFFDWGEERGQKIYYEPQPFSYWLMETEVDPNWGASSAAWKMRKIPLYDD
jgi:DNA polymerase III alpha subunit